jgi:hypothetical protein
MKAWKMIYQANGPQKQVRVAKLTSDKVDFKPTLVKRDKEGHFILIKGVRHQKEITIINLYAHCQCIHVHQTYTKGPKAHIDSNTMVLRDFNTPLSPIDRSLKHKINKEILGLNHTIN